LNVVATNVTNCLRPNHEPIKVNCLPDGISTAANGFLTCFSVASTASNGALGVPLKLNPNTASTMTWYSESISAAEGRLSIKGSVQFLALRY